MTELRGNVGWPAVTHSEHYWEVSEDGFLSRSQRLRNRGVFLAGDPAPIAGCTVDLAADVQEEARAATALMERFDQSALGWGAPFASVLLRSESASSSQIERLTASARRIALATLGDDRSVNAAMIARNTRAMQAAVSLADSPGVDAILAMHRELGGGDDPVNSGRFREQWVWIGGHSPVTARFVATHHSNVPGAIADLAKFMARTDVEPLTQAAIAHAQFETIHPFTDGNGRTGRALVSAILRQREVARNMSVPISAGLLVDTERYFDALIAYRTGDLHPVVGVFTEAAQAAVANAMELRRDSEQVREAILATGERQTASLRAIAEICATEPAFTIGMLVERGIAESTAYRTADRLVDRGLLRKERAINRATVWSVPSLVQALDEFALRAGRRG